MIELQPNEFTCVTPLLKGIQQKVYPYAICQGNSPGRIFVDSREYPHMCLIWSALGYYFIAGSPGTSHDLINASQVLREIFIPASQAGGENSLILVAAQEGWKEHLPALLPGREVIEIYRRPFRFDRTHFLALPPWRNHIPPGCQLQVIQADLVNKIGVLPGWFSDEAFLSKGLGIALWVGDEIASLCTSVFASDEYMEIDIHTEEKYQRKGYALLVAAAFIEECLRRGKLPNWECFWENEASTALAEKMGFKAEADYPVYYWEEGSVGACVTP